MRTKDVLASLIGSGRGLEDAAADVDWVKVRRVQYGFHRPHDASAGSCHGFRTEHEFRAAEARSRQALRLAYGLALLTGVILGFAFLQGFADELRLLCAVALLATAAMHSAGRSYRCWDRRGFGGEL